MGSRADNPSLWCRHPVRDSRYECLFEPVRLGPVTARNRFYQVPHCTGMGWKRPRMLAAMRGVKAEGGWGVVCTEYCSVHPTSDDGAYPFARLWDDTDIRDHALMTEAVHAHGALAGVELWLGGSFIANLDTRLPPLGVISRPPTNVDVFRESRMTVDDVLAVGADHVLVATGSHWTTDGVGRARNLPFAVAADAVVVGADAVLAGEGTPSGRAVVFDDDHYYLGAVIALALRARGNAVTLVTPAGRAGQWSSHTNEQYASVRAMLHAGIEIVINRVVDRIAPDGVTALCVFSGRRQEIGADWVLPLTRREPHDALYHAVRFAVSEHRTGAPKTVARIGDCLAPGTIAAAVYSGYRAALETNPSRDSHQEA